MIQLHELCAAGSVKTSNPIYSLLYGYMSKANQKEYTWVTTISRTSHIKPTEDMNNDVGIKYFFTRETLSLWHLAVSPKIVRK